MDTTPTRREFLADVSRDTVVAAARSAFRWRQLVALVRVTASEYGRPAAGVAEAKALLKV